MENIFFNNWESLTRTFILTVLAYITIVILLRISGKRSLSKMNAFDFVVTVALGSSLATIALNKNISLAEGASVFTIFIFLQFIITWLSVRNNFVKRIVSSEPVLLLYKGELLHETLKKERIPIEELYVAARSHGITDLKEIDAIVLETTGDFSVIPKIEVTETEALNDVKNYDFSKKIQHRDKTTG